MAQFYPVILPGGNSLQGASLGFHAYSLRIDNLTNQWLLEETSLAWIPPYSLGVCLRLYGTAVALLLNRAPVGQLQLPAVAGEETVGVYSDQLRTEVTGQGIRQYTLVQAVSDISEGPQPALPPVGVCRIWADASGDLFHLHSDGTDPELWDTRLSFGGTVLTGTCPDPGLAPGCVQTVNLANGAVTSAKLGAGAAAANVGGLGGVLTGTLPNPDLALGATFVQAILAADSPIPAGVPVYNAVVLNVPVAGRYLAFASWTIANASALAHIPDIWMPLNQGSGWGVLDAAAPSFPATSGYQISGKFSAITPLLVAGAQIGLGGYGPAALTLKKATPNSTQNASFIQAIRLSAT